MPVVLKKLVGLLSGPGRESLERALSVCLSRKHFDVRPEHWLLTMFEDSDTDVNSICQKFDVDVQRVRRDLEASLAQLATGNERSPALSAELVKLMTDAWLLGSINLGARKIRTGFVLLAILETPSLQVRSQLESIDPERLASEFDVITNASGEAVQPPLAARLVKPPDRSKHDARLRIFVSYRRNDAATAASLIATRLQLAGFYVFQDTDTMPPGAVFTETIRATLEECDAVVAVIGRKWAGGADHRGASRLDNEQDWVRIEIATALRLDKLVIPCLVGTATFPAAEDLPENVRPILSRNAVRISEKNIQRDIRPVLDVLSRIAEGEE